MKSLFAFLALAAVAVTAAPDSVNAGLFCRAKTSCCEPACCTPEPVCCMPAPVCCAPAPVCCPMPVMCTTPEPACCPDPCVTPRRGLLRRLLHCSEPCSPASCCEPAPCHMPAPAPCCAPVAPCCGSTSYGHGYGYGIATNRPHWF